MFSSFFIENYFWGFEKLLVVPKTVNLNNQHISNWIGKKPICFIQCVCIPWSWGSIHPSRALERPDTYIAWLVAPTNTSRPIAFCWPCSSWWMVSCMHSVHASTRRYNPSKKPYLPAHVEILPWAGRSLAQKPITRITILKPRSALANNIGLIFVSSILAMKANTCTTIYKGKKYIWPYLIKKGRFDSSN